jgi:hypothetical protein
MLKEKLKKEPVLFPFPGKERQITANLFQAFREIRFHFLILFTRL